MRRHVNRLWIAVPFVVVATMLLYAGLFWLASVRIDPVTWVAAPDELQYRFHGKPVLNALGMAVWALTIAAYGLITTFIAVANSGRGRCAVAVTVMSLLLVAFIHPLWIPLMLPQSLRNGYVSLHRTWSLPIGPSQYALDVNSAVVALPHALLTAMVIFAFARKRNRIATP